jgi:hypothetical protein
MMNIFESTSEEWADPASPSYGSVANAVHRLPRYGYGYLISDGDHRRPQLDERTAGVLIPYMLYALLPSTVDALSAKGVDLQYGIEISGEWGGKWRATVKDGKFEAIPETGNFEGCEAIFSFDPSDFVLTTFQRFPGGARGDQEIEMPLFFAI